MFVGCLMLTRTCTRVHTREDNGMKCEQKTHHTSTKNEKKSYARISCVAERKAHKNGNDFLTKLYARISTLRAIFWGEDDVGC